MGPMAEPARGAKTALAGVPPLERTDGRLPAGALRVHLRSLILSGELPEGTVLSQVELAKALGVSRTPLREALRMLQEEGLVEAEPNRRARVTGFDPVDLDALYASRVLLEAHAIELTVSRMTEEHLARIVASVAAMRTAADRRDHAGWEETHSNFHMLLVQGVSERMRRTLRSQADRAERYRRLYQVADPRAWAIGDQEHGAIVDACVARDPELAARQLARHLARTALSLMAHLAPEQEPRAVRLALRTMLSPREGADSTALLDGHSGV